MQYETWEHDNHLIELLFDSSYNAAEIAKDIGVSETFVRQRIKLLGMDWVLRKNKGVSRGQNALVHIMGKLLPAAQIVQEYQVGERLRLDVYCPQYKIGAEYHGRQHYHHSVMFHPTYDDFLRAQERDERKIQLCREQGITLVVFRYCDELTEDAVFDRLLDALKTTAHEKPTVIKTKYSMKDSPYYVEQKHKRNAYARELRQKMKQERKTREQNSTQTDQEPDGLAQDFLY